MELRPTEIDGVVEFLPRKHGDARGWFSEVFRDDVCLEAGIDIAWVQDNQSFSAETGTLRGLHLQAPPRAQDKLVRVLAGSVLDVAVDIRVGSPTYGRWVAVELTAEKLNALLVPKGFAHGFITLEPDTMVLYKVSAFYNRESERAIAWDDPDLAIAWPSGLTPILSDKDKVAPRFAKLEPVFTHAGVRP